jgi:hypothetical protein
LTVAAAGELSALEADFESFAGLHPLIANAEIAVATSAPYLMYFIFSSRLSESNATIQLQYARY